MKSARINFGIPDSEYIMEVDDSGAATSLVNQDTNTEYVGGGGGGSSDFSTAVLTLNNPRLVNVKCPFIMEEPIPYIDVNMTQTGTYIVPLFKGNCVLQFEDETTVTCDGNIEALVEGFAYKITGDAEVTIS